MYLTIALSIIVNFILYLAFGSFLCVRKNKDFSLGATLLFGFFTYYSIFFMFCVPIMVKFRPLSMLTKIWVPVALLIVVASVILFGKSWYSKLRSCGNEIRKHPVIYLLLSLIVIFQIVIVTSSYNFTLDAAYYVANVATSVKTNMMNVYDPFTGAWQDHFEMRYFFATYQINDAVICQLTGIPALIQTKSVMAATIIILTNIVYYLIARLLLSGDESNKKTVLMMFMIFFLNLFFVTIYTSSLFLMTRTYEGKAIVGNLSIMTVFYLFIRLLSEEENNMLWVSLFLTCFGSTTISSSANMLIPAELSVLLIPVAIMKKKLSIFVKYLICAIPGICFALAFVLYVKGYFVLYTYPR